VRPTGFLSDMAELYSMPNKGRVYLFGDGQYKSNSMHGDDLAKVCIDAIDSVEKEMLVGGSEIFTQVELENLALVAAGKREKIRFIRNWVRISSLKLCELL